MSKMWDDIPVLDWAVEKLKTMPGSLASNAPFLALFQAIVIVFAGQRVTEEKTMSEKQLDAKVICFVYVVIKLLLHLLMLFNQIL